MHNRLFPSTMAAMLWVALLACPRTVIAATPSSAGVEEGFLARYAATYRFRLGQPAVMRPTPDGRTLLFLRSAPRSFVRDLYALDLSSGQERLLLSADRLLGGEDEALTAEERARRERQRLAARGITDYEIARDGRRLLVPLSGRLFVVEMVDGSVRELSSGAGPALDPRLSPDGRSVACVRDGDLYVTDIASGEERRLTRSTSPTVTHGVSEFVAQEEMSRHHGFWWSPDSRRIAYQQTDTAGMEVMHIMDPTHPEAAAARWPYPRPGRRNADVRLGIVAATGGEPTWVDWDREEYEYLATVKWPPNAPLTILVQNRRQTEERLLRVDPADGSTATLLVERDPAWIEIDQQMPQWLPDGSGFLWTTERNGGLQVELRGADGGLDRALTGLSLGLQAFEHYFPGTGSYIVRAGDDPTQSHLWRLDLDPLAAPTRLTREPGVHVAESAGPGPLFVVRSALLSGERRDVAWTASGSTGLGPRSLAEDPGLRPRLEFTTIGAEPAYRAVLIRPARFDVLQRYPVIVHVYGGPTSQMVRADPRRYLLDQWMADHGYVVVSVDGRGTPNRGRAWSRAVKHDLIALPLQDQAEALRLLGQKYPELDLDRVGVYGWSFGGYFSAMAVMRRPDVFRAGVAGAPVVDWRDYDTHYTERYMGLPADNPEGYAATNVLSYAARLSRPLLLIHGTADDNVYFTHSLKLADALFREGKTFAFLPLPGFTHMVPDPLVTRRLYDRIMGHFDRNLISAPLLPEK